MNSPFQRTELLAGPAKFARLASLRVLVVGVGGVGSWCAEALVRSGVGHITIVDRDVVDITNINRQLPALHSSIGKPKVDVLAAHFRDINPKIDVEVRYEFYSEENADTFDLDSYDFVVDAIDSLKSKAELILRATRAKTTLLSSMGAARKTDLTKIAITEFWKVQGCPLARALRQWFKRHELFPARKFLCAYSPERAPQPIDDPANGTYMHTTAAFGLALAGEIIKKA